MKKKIFYGAIYSIFAAFITQPIYAGWFDFWGNPSEKLYTDPANPVTENKDSNTPENVLLDHPIRPVIESHIQDNENLNHDKINPDPMNDVENENTQTESELSNPKKEDTFLATEPDFTVNQQIHAPDTEQKVKDIEKVIEENLSPTERNQLQDIWNYHVYGIPLVKILVIGAASGLIGYGAIATLGVLGYGPYAKIAMDAVDKLTPQAAQAIAHLGKSSSLWEYAVSFPVLLTKLASSAGSSISNALSSAGNAVYAGGGYLFNFLSGNIKPMLMEAIGGISQLGTQLGNEIQNTAQSITNIANKLNTGIQGVVTLLSTANNGIGSVAKGAYNAAGYLSHPKQTLSSLGQNALNLGAQAFQKVSSYF